MVTFTETYSLVNLLKKAPKVVTSLVPNADYCFSYIEFGLSGIRVLPKDSFQRTKNDRNTIIIRTLEQGWKHVDLMQQNTMP